MKTPHKHADVIKAWADGAEIEFYDTRFGEHRWKSCGNTPCWDERFEYRIKPMPKEDIEMTRRISILVEPNPCEPNGLVNVTAGFRRNVRFIFDGETRELKHVEML
jgi:hypothetical protein